MINVENRNLEINENNSGFLLETAKWTRFLSIVGFVGIGILILFGLLGGTFMANMTSSMPGGTPVSPFFLTILYLIMAAIYFAPVYYLWQFSAKLKTAITSASQYDLDSALEYLKSHYKYVGIVTIVVLSIYAFSFIMMLLFFLAASR